MNWTVVTDQNRIKKILLDKDGMEWDMDDMAISLVQRNGKSEFTIYARETWDNWKMVAESSPQDSISFIHDIEDYLPHPMYRTIACGYIVP